MNHPLICIVGPTSSGKSALAEAMALRVNGELINADARQMYCGFEIGTGAVRPAAIPCHGYADRDPNEGMTMGQWVIWAKEKIAEIESRGKRPIIVGGTGLYVRALIDGFVPPAPVSLALRGQVQAMTPDERLAKLKERDPDALANIDARNPRRVQRALELAMSGTSVRDAKKTGTLPAIFIGRERTSEALRARIEKAVEKQFADGWEEEVRARMKDTPMTAPAWTAIGYREIAATLMGSNSSPLRVPPLTLRGGRTESDPPLDTRGGPEGGGVMSENLHQSIIRATWQYARRQRTWWRKDTRIHWVNDVEEAMKLIG
jgi:tRNA dimethylallyltransferase